MSNISEVQELIGLCERYGLSGIDFIRRFSISQLVENYNGIGPEWFPSWARKILDNICRVLLPMVLIHDVRFSHSDGSVEQFVAANDELRANGYKIAEAEYACYNPMRYIIKHRVRVLYRLCRDFGWTAYVAGYLKKEQQKNKE